MGTLRQGPYGCWPKLQTLLCFAQKVGFRGMEPLYQGNLRCYMCWDGAAHEGVPKMGGGLTGSIWLFLNPRESPGPGLNSLGLAHH